MNDQQLATFGKLLYIALGYGSREQRIAAMFDSADLDVAMLAQIMHAKGLLPDKRAQS